MFFKFNKKKKVMNLKWRREKQKEIVSKTIVNTWTNLSIHCKNTNLVEDTYFRGKIVKNQWNWSAKQ